MYGIYDTIACGIGKDVVPVVPVHRWVIKIIPNITELKLISEIHNTIIAGAQRLDAIIAAINAGVLDPPEGRNI